VLYVVGKRHWIRRRKRRAFTKLLKIAKKLEKGGISTSEEERLIDQIAEVLKKDHPPKPLTIRLFICKRCRSFLRPGVNARVRIRSRRRPHLVITCLTCGQIRRIVYKPPRPPTKRSIGNVYGTRRQADQTVSRVSKEE